MYQSPVFMAYYCLYMCVCVCVCVCVSLVEAVRLLQMKSFSLDIHRLSKWQAPCCGCRLYQKHRLLLGFYCQLKAIIIPGLVPSITVYTCRLCFLPQHPISFPFVRNPNIWGSLLATVYTTSKSGRLQFELPKFSSQVNLQNVGYLVGKSLLRILH